MAQKLSRTHELMGHDGTTHGNKSKMISVSGMSMVIRIGIIIIIIIIIIITIIITIIQTRIMTIIVMTTIIMTISSSRETIETIEKRPGHKKTTTTTTTPIWIQFQPFDHTFASDVLSKSQTFS